MMQQNDRFFFFKFHAFFFLIKLCCLYFTQWTVRLEIWVS